MLSHFPWGVQDLKAIENQEMQEGVMSNKKETGKAGLGEGLLRAAYNLVKNTCL